MVFGTTLIKNKLLRLDPRYSDADNSPRGLDLQPHPPQSHALKINIKNRYCFDKILLHCVKLIKKVVIETNWANV